MPELPDVEEFSRVVRTHAIGLAIRNVTVHDAKILRSTSPSELQTELHGRTICAARRHGKWLFIVTDAPELVVHFGMTGSLRWTLDVERQLADRLVIELGTSRLVINDPRNLATVAIVTSDAERRAVTGALGPDARTITRAELDELAGRRTLKTTLLDQSLIAGLGNMLTDEILWRSRLDPTRSGEDLSSEERHQLHRTLRHVLSRAVAAGHIPRGPTWLSSQRNQPQPTCPRCARPLAWRRIAARSSLWCPVCQN